MTVNPSEAGGVPVPMSRVLICLCLTATLSGAAAWGLPPVPQFRPSASPPAAGLRACVKGDVRLLVDASGRVRFLEHGHLYPDNQLWVRQSYDRAGRLSGVRVQWSGFAGELLNVRGAFDSRGRLVRETGYRHREVVRPLRSYLRPLPRGAAC
ncbi:hypothetical protein Deide_08091 [Deinococcus deserti VCD115]|uniref:Uncharacterized protein n=2 Tax=Deinococcus TaxID=1298 RepID=C1D1F2_DEIDV|nr:hypothetical protein Deide_08091 [Deinococcus deserti VCD115]